MTRPPRQAPPAEPGDRGRWWARPLRVGAVVVVAAVAVALLWKSLPSAAQLIGALAAGHPGWLAAAVALELAATNLFARQQHRLLAAFGVSMSVVRVGAITYSSTAIANSMPAGAAVSAGWSLRQFRARGASGATAATVTLLSGALSIAGLLLLGLVNLLVASSGRLVAVLTEDPLRTAGVGLAGLAAGAVLVRAFGRRRADRAVAGGDGTPRLDRYESTHPRLGGLARQLLTTGRQARHVRWTDWMLALGLASSKWILDAASLYSATRAFGIEIDLLPLVALYLGVQLVRQIPLTPGGVGLVEVALLAGLVAVGAPDAAAAAAVLVYRLASTWLMIPLGYTALAALRRWDRRHAAVPGVAGPGR